MKATRLLALALYVIGTLGGVGLSGVASAVLNGSFETPTVTNTPPPTWQLFNDVPPWKMTTPSNNNTQIEIWQSNFLSVPAYAGNQFTELNAAGTGPWTLYQDISVLPGSRIHFSFAHRGRSGTNTMDFSITDQTTNTTMFTKAYSAGNGSWSVNTSAGEPAITTPTAFAGVLRVSFQSVVPTNTEGNLIDAVEVTATSCRIVSLKSNEPVALASKPTLTSVLYGSGAFNATCVGAACDVVIKILDPGQIFDGKGLIYNDGQFPVSMGCVGTWEECFLTQSPNPFPTTAPPFDLSAGSGLTLTSGTSGTIKFLAGFTYSYTGGKFQSHSGTYKVKPCEIPEPGTFVLMLLPLAGLRAVRRRRQRA